MSDPSRDSLQRLGGTDSYERTNELTKRGITLGGSVSEGDARVAGEPRPVIAKATTRVRRPFDIGQRHEAALAYAPVGYTGPRRDCPLGFVYVVEFSFGVVKVGQTIAPRGRLRSHILDAIRFNGDVTRWWLSDAHLGWRENEAALINWCDDHGRQTFGEYFADIAFDAVCDFAETLR